jgi:NhaA family Na+:H+ antiporter
VVGFVWLAVVTGITSLPRGANWSGMIGIGLLAGIGFTMSLFIAYLAFGQSPALDEVKVGVLAASVVAALAGLGFLRAGLAAADRPVTAEA